MNVPGLGLKTLRYANYRYTNTDWYNTLVRNAIVRSVGRRRRRNDRLLRERGSTGPGDLVLTPTLPRTIPSVVAKSKFTFSEHRSRHA